jgi:ketosteroid isomerase-like protein
MKTQASVTETVVQNHLRAFLEQQGVPAIVSDYDDNARFITETRIYRGKGEIQAFFTEFIGSLPSGAIDQFALRSLQIDGEIAYITWCVGDDIPLGTDTLVVTDGKIVVQTFAMHAAPAG